MKIKVHKTKIKESKWKCDDCEKILPCLFVVKQELWYKIIPKEEWKKRICLNCFETRLNRKLCLEDMHPTCGHFNEIMLGLFLYFRQGKPEIEFEENFLKNY